MQFIKCTREALLKPLQTVGGIVQGRQTLPILANILISKNGDKVDFTTTDLEIQIKTSATIGIGADEFKTTLPAAKTIALLTALPGSGTEVSLRLMKRKFCFGPMHLAFLSHSWLQKIILSYPAVK